MIIAIDGPAGVGKSTVAKAAASRLGFVYLDTGAMYRAVTWRALETGAELADEGAVAAIAVNDAVEFAPGGAVAIAGEDVTKQIRTPQVDANVSAVSAMPPVREALTRQQRRLGEACDVVMEGRDIGTVVFPAAEVKVFLTATAQERARRRALQNEERGMGETDAGILLAQIERRDALDSTRETAPLTAAADATVIDTTNMTLDEVVDAVCALAEMRRAPGREGDCAASEAAAGKAADPHGTQANRERTSGE